MIVSTFLVGSEDPELYSMTDGLDRGNNIDLGTVIEWSKNDPIWSSRGKAIQAYAQLESTLSRLLVSLTGMTWEAAVTMFYKITNTNARNAILEKLLQQKFGTKFNAFWNPLLKEIKQIDLKRNEIVHWLAAANVLINSNQQMLVGVVLIPPASLHTKDLTLRITSRNLHAFQLKCIEISAVVSSFAIRL